MRASRRSKNGHFSGSIDADIPTPVYTSVDPFENLDLIKFNKIDSYYVDLEPLDER